MEKGGDLPINRGFGASQEKWSNLRSIIIPTPLPLREKSQKRGKAALYTGVKFAPVGGRLGGRAVGIFGAASLNLV